jgi:hypothetical protein
MEFFIAEQPGIPPLYAELWKLSGGPTDDDHVWHRFYELSPATPEELGKPVFDTLNNVIFKFKFVKTGDERLSLHWTTGI